MSGRVLTVEEGQDSVIITGILDDGVVDADSQLIDPEWLMEAATKWLQDRPAITDCRYCTVGVADRVWQGGEDWEISMMRARITEPRAQALLRDGALKGILVGIMHPRLVDGELVDGELLHVMLTRGEDEEE